MLYQVRRIQTLTTTYEVDAPSEVGALDLVVNGKVKEVGYTNEAYWEIEEDE